MPVIRSHPRERVVVMPRADRNLMEAVDKERFAGRSLPRVVSIVRDVALALKDVHDKGWVHADVKPRNIVRIGACRC